MHASTGIISTQLRRNYMTTCDDTILISDYQLQQRIYYIQDDNSANFSSCLKHTHWPDFICNS